MPPARNPGTNLAATLEIARRDLLDLGLRNTLLNYRPLRGKGVEVVDERPVELFRLLVREEKNLTFLANETGEAIGNPLAQPEEDGAIAARHRDLRLQTDYTSAQLQSRLLATWHASRTSMEEQGVNTLYLALGMLSWREEDDGDKFCRAPLILIPAELERSNARDRFHVKYNGDELGENVSLGEKLYECARMRFQLGDQEMHLVDRARLADLLAQVVKVESPVHSTEAMRRILASAGIERMGNRIQLAFEEALRLGRSRQLFVHRDEFLWSPDMQQPPVRDRSELPAASRKLELVSPEEIRQAILMVAQASCGIAPAEVPEAVCRLFGFARVTDEMSAAVEPHREALLREGRLALEGVNLVVAAGS